MVHNRIREVRKAARITQEQLAKSLGVNRATLSRYESGDIDPPSSQLQRIATALNVSVPELIGLEQIDKYTWGKEVGPEVYKKIEENYLRHHRAQARANAAMDQMSEEGKRRVADYAEDILPRYQAQQPPQPTLDSTEDTDTIQPPKGSEDK